MVASILVVCIGNICRSPMAEGLLRTQLPGVRVESAGLSALVGRSAEPYAVSLMADQGIDIGAHRARQLVTSHCKEVDLILVMDEEQRRVVQQKYPFAFGRVFRIGHFEGFDVPDPYKGSEAEFAASGQLIEKGVSGWISRIRSLS
ncbi:low molecular weight protein-tyrosine-phosphatase [Burkholderia pseudomultivorans]|uniref:protein-tyrosine-phosphatase n=1 Tax=Burkholderia pseudomultivorans TaxID=1207504 RepID=A0A6P2KEX1_9BURK|nr:low molecular weight protein-tyrosine-phosphatase [Burkholderia pseudomultivorans]MDR8726498.1 Low molecular weight protein-tyrosine-phosphatase Ptp [Burkholderia pseudomultivorans]MDR8736331.1 Low molecular weight protein-tyrosine-phosphatase Ptp [Burkholderia pseudomultivorans]MDR8742145.1 Low molecular weight protein-tyrosine-phosphatase Ptp [Burkholderia pseudomultivorans]MDR8753929.1 Low molecular weight protein-tyrosine-phosphatase Ptp [Burkholderia pseudomultivorans]MDR8778961.1 Low 